MTQDPQMQATAQAETRPSDKEINFRRQQQMYEAKLAEKEARIAEIERQLNSTRNAPADEDDRDDEPYVDKRKLSKELNKFAQQNQQQTQSDIQRAVQQAIAEERRQNWLKQNPDFSEVMSHAEKFAQQDPELAETILNMPEGFERQKLVYKSIKSLGLHKPAEEKKSIQDTINKNRGGAFYQPTNNAPPPYGIHTSVGRDYSAQEGQNALAHIRALQQRLRLG